MRLLVIGFTFQFFCVTHNLKIVKNHFNVPLLTKLSAEKVIVVIFAPCSLPLTEDEVVVKETIESILLAKGKGLVEWVKDNPITAEVLKGKILSAMRSQNI